MNIKARFFTVAALLLFTSATARANVTLPDVLSDAMVLQRNMRVSIWGRADAGEAVTVRFAGQTKKTIADANGNWRINLDKLHANAVPAMMTVEGKNKITLSDILVGEVWLLSGQSNMQLILSQTANGAAVTEAAQHPQLRLFNVSRDVAFQRKPPPLASWRACTPDSVKQFSAAGYYFGVALQKALNVPVGLINSSYGGSQAEAFTPVEYLLASEDLRPTVERNKVWLAEKPQVQVEYDAALKKWRAESEAAKAAGARSQPSPPVPDALRENRPAAVLYDRMIAPLVPFAMRGAFWYQGESNEARAQQYGILLPIMIRAWRERWPTPCHSLWRPATPLITTRATRI